MSREKYIEKVEKVRYSCHSCGYPLPTKLYTDNEEMQDVTIVFKGDRLDFHKGCLFKHLKETWIPYKN